MVKKSISASTRGLARPNDLSPQSLDDSFMESQSKKMSYLESRGHKSLDADSQNSEMAESFSDLHLKTPNPSSGSSHPSTPQVPYNSSTHLIRSNQTIQNSSSSANKDYKQAVMKFKQNFEMPDEEKLVNWYSCAFIENLMVWQGWIYLSQNHCCFYSYLLGKSKKFIVPWTDIKNLERKETVLLPESIIVEIRQNSSSFGSHGNNNHSKFKFTNFMTDTKSVYNDMKRLTEQAMRSLIDHDSSFNNSLFGNNFDMTASYDSNFGGGGGGSNNNNNVFGNKYGNNLSSNALGSGAGNDRNPSSSSNQNRLKRQLDARAKSFRYINFFRLPKNEILDGFVPCSLWLNYDKKAAAGTLYLSQNYACFSDGKEGVAVVIPLRNVGLIERSDSSSLPKVSFALLYS